MAAGSGATSSTWPTLRPIVPDLTPDEQNASWDANWEEPMQITTERPPPDPPRPVATSAQTPPLTIRMPRNTLGEILTRVLINALARAIDTSDLADAPRPTTPEWLARPNPAPGSVIRAEILELEARGFELWRELASIEAEDPNRPDAVKSALKHPYLVKLNQIGTRLHSLHDEIAQIRTSSSRPDWRRAGFQLRVPALEIHCSQSQVWMSEPERVLCTPNEVEWKALEGWRHDSNPTPRGEHAIYWYSRRSSAYELARRMEDTALTLRAIVARNALSLATLRLE